MIGFKKSTRLWIRIISIVFVMYGFIKNIPKIKTTGGILGYIIGGLILLLLVLVLTEPEKIE